jgi:sec-independent protein translocase protein TatB
MFDIDSGKLLILGVIALIVIKPKDLPGVLRQVGQTIGQLRRMAAEFQGQFREAMHEAELEQLKKDVQKATDIDGLDPFDDVKKDMAKTEAEIRASLDTPQAEYTFNQPIEPPPHPQAEAPHLPDPARLKETAQPVAAEPAPDAGAAPKAAS